MTATLTTTVPTTTTTTARRSLWKTGAISGLAAAGATAAFAATVHAAGVSLDVSGEPIPVIGFAQVTFVAAMIGTVLAVVLRRRATRPAHTFLRTTIALTALSFVPDVFADAHVSTRISLALSHVVAAVIVIPALSSRLSD
jgi:hypothetical protein